MSQYAGKSGIYFYKFQPNDGVECDWEYTEEGREYNGFGVNSHSKTRPNSYDYDKTFEKTWITDFYVCKSRSDASSGERRIKRVIDDLGIRIKYGTKKECFVATEEELKIVKNEVVKHIKQLKLDDKEGLERFKLRLDMEKDLAMFNIKQKLFIDGHITFEQLEKLLK